jgi:hypothetical protein
MMSMNESCKSMLQVLSQNFLCFEYCSARLFSAEEIAKTQEKFFRCFSLSKMLVLDEVAPSNLKENFKKLLPKKHIKPL